MPRIDRATAVAGVVGIAIAILIVVVAVSLIGEDDAPLQPTEPAVAEVETTTSTTAAPATTAPPVAEDDDDDDEGRRPGHGRGRERGDDD